MSSKNKRTSSKPKWEHVGYASVDSGTIWIGDPCYVMTPEANSTPAKTWKEFCSKMFKGEKNGVMQWNHEKGHPGLGVTIGQFGGDGTYPIRVLRDEKTKLVQAAMIAFIPDEKKL